MARETINLFLFLIIIISLPNYSESQKQEADNVQLLPEQAHQLAPHSILPKDESEPVKSKYDFFSVLDKNHDGYLTESEYEEGFVSLLKVLQKKTTVVEEKEWFTWFKKEKQSDTNIEDLDFFSAFTKSVSMIIATEIGDKTFFIAAVMSMRYDRRVIFTGALSALIVMTILSSMMGLILPSFLPRKYTHIIGGILFLYFGSRLLLDSRSMSSNKCSDELEEVECELLSATSSKSKKEDHSSPDDIDIESFEKKEVFSWKQVLINSFMLTFLAEWGDRSQIATIALAAAKDPYGVNIGAIVGHAICTGMAVIGGRLLAASISEKTVTFWGGIIFWIFGIHSLFFED